VAGNNNSGGFRPTAPQNNNGVSATGGAGSKNGQPKRYISGGTYGQGKALMQQQQGAPMSSGPAPVQSGMATMPAGKPVGTLTDPSTNPSEPVTAGVDFGPGVGSAALPSIKSDLRPDENQKIIQKYFPVLLRASQLPDTPDSYKRFISYLSGKING
jgi:hypothetical protein